MKFFAMTRVVAMRVARMEKSTDSASGVRRIDRRVDYAKLMGEANYRRMSLPQRFEDWWDRHPKTVFVLGMIWFIIVVGLIFYHEITFPSLN